MPGFNPAPGVNPNCTLEAHVSVSIEQLAPCTRGKDKSGCVWLLEGAWLIEREEHRAREARTNPGVCGC
jgi:hypothetical protein